VTALSPLASLIAALQIPLTGASVAAEAAPLPFLDVFGGLMAKGEPGSEAEPQPEADLRSQTGPEGKPAPAPPKPKKAQDSGEPIATAQVMPTPEIVPMPQVVPVLPVSPVLAVAPAASVTAPAPAAESAPPPADPVEIGGPDHSRESTAPAAPVKELPQTQLAAVPEQADVKATTSNDTFQRALKESKQSSRPPAPDRPVRMEALEPPRPETPRSETQLPPPMSQDDEPVVPTVTASIPAAALPVPNPAAPKDRGPETETSPKPRAAPQAEQPKMRQQNMLSYAAPMPAPEMPGTKETSNTTLPAPPEPTRSKDVETGPPKVREVTERTAPPVAETKGDTDAEVRRPIPLAFAAKLVPAADPAHPESGPPLNIEPNTESKPKPKVEAKAVPDRETFEPAATDEPAPQRTVKAETADMPDHRKAAPADAPRARTASNTDSRQDRQVETPDPPPARDAVQDARAILPNISHDTAPASSRSTTEADRTQAPPRTVMSGEVARPAQPPAAVRDIRLELSGGEQRVEVRLMERGGEVHVAVRTPDTQLAGALRENLPSLSARLEQTGMRTESWHGGTDAAAERRTEAAQSSRGESGDTQERSNSQGREQRDDNPRRSRETEGQPHRRAKGTSFSWFMPSHT
jgi:hypothetical protein